GACGEGRQGTVRESAKGVRVRSRWLERGQRRRIEAAGRPRGGPGPPRQGAVAGRGEGQGQVGFGASTGRGMYRVGEVTEVRVQQARGKIGGGDGSMRATLRLGIQPEQADERVGGATKGRTGRVIRCGLLQTKPPKAISRLSRKTNACSVGEVRQTAAKFPGKL